MTIKTLAELIIMLERYKNPYIITRYKGIDWMNHIQYSNGTAKSIHLSKNLYLVSCQNTSSPYKIYGNDFIHILEGELLIDHSKLIYTHFFNDNKNNKHFSLCKGNKFYNSFLHYRH